jgi:hypothetical protein
MKKSNVSLPLTFFLAQLIYSSSPSPSFNTSRSIFCSLTPLPIAQPFLCSQNAFLKPTMKCQWPASLGALLISLSFILLEFVAILELQMAPFFLNPSPPHMIYYLLLFAGYSFSEFSFPVSIVNLHDSIFYPSLSHLLPEQTYRHLCF